MNDRELQIQVDRLSEHLLTKTRTFFGLKEDEDLSLYQAKIFLSTLQLFLRVVESEVEKIEKNVKRIIT